MRSSDRNSRQYEYDEGETQGHSISSQYFLIDQLQPRHKKGKSYAKKYLAEEPVLNIGLRSNQDFPRHEELKVNPLGTASHCSDLLNEKVYDIKNEFYKEKSKSNSNLIIHNFKQQILTLIEGNEVVVLTGPTGCGKTTQVPQYVLDSSMENLQYCNIAVTQPRRLSAVSVAKRVCDERDWELGRLCGFKVGLKDRTSPQTLLTFMTTGILLQTLIKKKSMSQYTHIILDEIHERDQSMDFLLVVIKKLLNHTSSNTKIVLMSATVEAQKFANYFQKCYEGNIIPSPVITIDRQTNFAVDIYYLDDLDALGDFQIPRVGFADTRISEELYDVCINLIKKFDEYDNDEKWNNSVLIFLPGIFEIEHLYFKLRDPNVYSSGKYTYKWSPLPLHSSVTIEEQAEVFLPSKSGYRKIILSTNVAESSITVPGVKYVIDFCLVKRMKTDPVTNFNGLQVCWASQTSCIQRAGRVGRIMEGKVYRMVSKKLFQKLEKETKPEILDAPLDKIILQIKMLDMGEPKAVLALALDPPDLVDIEWTILTLKEIGGLLRHRNGVYTPHDGDLTFLGRLMAVLPVDIRSTKLIAMGHIFGCLNECIIMAASMFVKNVFSHPFRYRLKAYDLKRTWAENSFSDCIALLNVYNLWNQHHIDGYFDRSNEDDEMKWASRHFLQVRVLREIQLLVEELKDRLKAYHIEETCDDQDSSWNFFERTLFLKVAIAGAFYPHYFYPGFQYGNTCEQEAVKELAGRNPFTTVMIHGFPPDQPLELYSGLIKNFFSDLGAEMRLCSNNYGKVLLEFRHRQLRLRLHGERTFDEVVPNKILVEVYRALKIGRTRKSFPIKLLPALEANRRMQLLRPRRRIGRQENSAATRNFIPCPLPAVDISTIDIRINHIVDPGHFWASYSENARVQKKIFDFILKNFSKCRPFEKTPVPGEMCIAPLKESTNTCFYRGRIQSVRKDPEPSVEVFFVDHGSCRRIKVSDIRRYGRLVRRLKRIPGQVFECVLSELRPSTLMNPKGEWTKASLSAFEKKVRGRQLRASIFSVVGGVVSLELSEIKSKAKVLSINQFLLMEKHAEKATESHFSRLNRTVRTETVLTDYQKSICNQLQEREFWPADVENVPLDENELVVKAQLKGPTSPLEMTIRSCTRNSMNKSVSIYEDSVNSILLNTEPSDRHDRLIVAGYISHNLDGSKLLINHTTIMPNIHGLAALIPFLFSPEVELRVNKDGTKYAGMLCGLGTDHKGQALFPEHDIEIYFDSEITYEDFQVVNRLRYYMSSFLMKHEAESFTKISDIANFQNKIRMTALKLLTKDRNPVDVDVSIKSHEWRKTAPDLLMDSNESLWCVPPVAYADFTSVKGWSASVTL